MSKPNVFGVFADLLEKASPDSMSPVLLAFCIVGFWVFTGSFFAALALTLLSILPLVLIVGVGIVGLWAGLRVLDLTRILAGPTAGLSLAEHGAEVEGREKQAAPET